ncbi:MAG: CubicO group peptidase (beta-lactamase class C family) [Psychromonas sp.]|jgi:CubicO group peptidase (beta-lactamase class C family)|uniref:serine hydrolase domain-containing protein n=1 Tax=Psychromonas sp. TaxID=1884585 RepID=UPI0039E3D2EF
MPKILTKHIILLSCLLTSFIISGCALNNTKPTPEQVSLSSYSGAYQEKWDDSNNVFVIERDNKLYFQNIWGITEIDINDEYGFKIDSWNLTAQFSDFENGKFQRGTGRVDGQSYEFKRINLDTQNSAFLYEKFGASDFSQTEKQSCQDNYSLQSLSENSKNPEKIETLIKQIKSERYGWGEQDSLIIYQDGKLVVEQYFNGYSRNDPHQIQGVGTSLTSLLVGSLITEGKIADVNAPIVEYLPEYKQLLTGDKAKITLANFMDMAAGIEWNEWRVPYTDPANTRSKEMESDDAVAFVLSLPMKHEPGKDFSYSGGYVSVVGTVISNLSQQPTAADYAKNGPLKALCFEDAYWHKQKDGKTNTAGGGMMRPIDMLKVGQLMLDDGQWQGQQLIDKQWVADSRDRTINTYNSKYGYFWLHDDAFVLDNVTNYPYVHASGWGGQEIVIMKELDLVVVTSASNYDSRGKVNEMLRNFIIPAFVD